MRPAPLKSAVPFLWTPPRARSDQARNSKPAAESRCPHTSNLALTTLQAAFAANVMLRHRSAQRRHSCAHGPHKA